MDRKQIADRKAALEQARDRLIAELNAVIGRIGECDFWLAELDKPALAPAPVAEPAPEAEAAVPAAKPHADGKALVPARSHKGG